MTGTGTHPCPAPRCTTAVPFVRLACSKHWFQLPRDLRAAIWKAWRADDHGRHQMLVARAVHLWIQSAAARARLIEEGSYLDGLEEASV